jgi:hypothetical protein
MSRPGSAAVHLASGVILFVAVSASAVLAQASSTAGVVKTVVGTASIVRGAQESPALPGQAILEGDTLKTGADGRIGVTLKDGTRLSLGGGTELRLDTFAYAPAQGRMGLALRLLRGVTAYVSGRIAQLAPGAVKIETPTSVIGIRGTHLLVGAHQP